MSNHYKKQGAKGAKPVADFVSKLLNPVIEQRAGMTMDLLAAWDDIVGAQHAGLSRAEKLIWPRQASDNEPFEPATLVVACEGGHALYLQHDSAQIINRINSYFGFAAVARLKLVQKPMSGLLSTREMQRRAQRQELPPQKQKDLSNMLKDVENPQLKAALERMGKGVFRQGSQTKK